MEKKKQTNILITPGIHLRLKVNAALLGLTIGDTIAYMVEQIKKIEEQTTKADSKKTTEKALQDARTELAQSTRSKKAA
jgi:macrodomain Ter protein organizer (MatP/YcbG family)